MLNSIINGDCLELMKTLDDNSVDLIFTDPPYALGSEIIIRADGKPDYKKAVDFMNKWDMPTADFWELWYKEATRILKHGGHCLMFGIDRQNFLFKYYASYAGFVSKQSLYWYFISSFPKACDLSKNIDKYFKANRDKVKATGGLHKNTLLNDDNWSKIGQDSPLMDSNIPATDLAKKYDGYKYSISPLKQTCEEIMVFQKPYKTGSCLHDVLAMENGDNSITCGALDIDRNKCGVEVIKNQGGNKHRKDGVYNPKKNWVETTHTGRFPAQTFIDSAVADKLDSQRETSKAWGVATNSENSKETSMFKMVGVNAKRYDNGGGGCSRILHKCDYDTQDIDLMIYCPKVSPSERNAGLEEFEEKIKVFSNQAIAEMERGNDPTITMNNTGNKFISKTSNNHPTVKPIKLLTHILKLFKTPNKQVILDAFAGSGSTLVACQNLELNFIGIELNKEYCDIANARLKHYKGKQQELFYD